ncbi:MAG: 3-demethylubiquinone-9 3-O-methyltransferase [Verrucomicrobia bacterium]|nr:3-demethylubiquinone-9 3-O-methyltransferase [Verrucomicrobiota bacterium]
MINNEFYNDLYEEWYTRSDHPIALLRAENAIRIPWILEKIGSKPAQVLDIGCGAGFLANALASSGHSVTGIDLSEPSLEIAKRFASRKAPKYIRANAYSLPFPDGSFDAVCAMDILEHVEEPGLVIGEAARMLKPGGQFFFHTFNRNWLSYFLVIKGVEWFVKNTPPNMHVYPLFITPGEMKDLCLLYKLEVTDLLGFQPKLTPKTCLHMAFKRTVPSTFSFSFTNKLRTGYCGIARKKSSMFR